MGAVYGDDIERELGMIATEVRDPRAGIFGPDSILWRVDREACIFLGAGRALMLQLAHPFVAAAIAEHSTTLSDPLRRFHGTFDTMFTLVFGDLEQALAAARRLHRRHAAVTGILPEAAGAFAMGTAYCANETSALAWVHATLAETALLAHDLVLAPLADEDRDRYCRESARLAALFGLAPGEQPQDWQSLRAKVSSSVHSDMICVTPAARKIAQEILSGAGSRLRSPRWYRDLTAGLLASPLRDGFGLRYGPAEKRRAARALSAIRRIYPLLPGRARHVGPYQEACSRLEGRDRPDAITQTVNRLWIGRPVMRR
jgi:uncharacterized protein (DUF2236 family)